MFEFANPLNMLKLGRLYCDGYHMSIFCMALFLYFLQASL